MSDSNEDLNSEKPCSKYLVYKLGLEGERLNINTLYVSHSTVTYGQNRIWMKFVVYNFIYHM
jgi:hypothetical protein